MPIISVVVPVYKVEKLLGRCVSSLQHQTFTDFEIILVDDGSPDHCGEMCDAYAKQDRRIKVVHKQNGGLASARNAGIRIASGDYLCFVDSDDYVSKDYAETIVSAIRQYGSDIVYFGWTYNDSNERVPLAFPTNIVQSGMEFIAAEPRIFSKIAVPFSWRYCIKKEFWIREKLSFNEQVKYAEDTPLNLMLLYLAKAMVCIDFYGYHYCNDSTGSITKSYKPTMVEDSDYIHSIKRFVGQKLQDPYEYDLDMAKKHLFEWIPSCIQNYKRKTHKLKLKQVKKLVDANFVQDCAAFYLEKDLCNRKLQKWYIKSLKKRRYFRLFLLWRFLPLRQYMLG